MGKSLAERAADGALSSMVASSVEVSEGFDQAKSYIASAMKLKAATGDNVPARFRLLYEAAHGLLVCALWAKGYEVISERGHRMELFNAQPEIIPLSNSMSNALLDAHELRNKISYGGRPHSNMKSMPLLVDDLELALPEMIKEADFVIKPWLRKMNVASAPAAPPAGTKGPGKT